MTNIYQPFQYSHPYSLNVLEKTIASLHLKLMEGIITHSRHPTPPLLYPQVRVCPVLKFVNPTGLVRLISVCFLMLIHCIKVQYIYNYGSEGGFLGVGPLSFRNGAKVIVETPSFEDPWICL
jgi:hypothetical protein